MKLSKVRIGLLLLAALTITALQFCSPQPVPAVVSQMTFSK